MIHKICYLFLLLPMLGCTEKTTKAIPNEPASKAYTQTFEQRVQRHIEAQLSIPHNEKYSVKIYKEHLDGDDKRDAVISINRLQYAMEEAIRTKNTAKQSELGYAGSYNYLLYYDGGKNEFTKTILIPSSSEAELIVSFEPIASEVYKDILVDYKIRNSSFRNIYTVFNRIPFQVFQWKLYDFLGEKNTEAFFFEYVPGTYSSAKDILIYKGRLTNDEQETNQYKFQPKITKSGALLHQFFYYEEQGKYFTKKH
jgi:hypothetical protein